MDFGTKVGMWLLALWAISMVIGVLIALAPIILFVVGFVMMVALLSLLVRLLGSWIGY